MRINYVLIDFESVQPESLDLLAHDHFRLLIFVGASQSKVAFEIAAAVQMLGHAQSTSRFLATARMRLISISRTTSANWRRRIRSLTFISSPRMEDSTR